MKSYRIRRRSSHETAIHQKENNPEQSFFGVQNNHFFQPSVAVQRKENNKDDEDIPVQRSSNVDADKMIQAKAMISGNTSVNNGYISNLNGKGNSLPQSANNFFSSKMQHDFSDVKIHTGNEAETSAQAINAKAYTVGNHIVFNKGQFDTASHYGKKLLAHELAHVVQNKAATRGNNILQRQITTPVPADAVINRRTRQARFTINDVNIVVEPDQTVRRGTSVFWRGASHTVNTNGAVTLNMLSVAVRPVTTGRGRSARVTGANVRFTLYIKTVYGRRASPTGNSGYGRGTTAEDIAAGNTSLQFHESMHGQDFQDFIRDNPLPVFNIEYPATIAEFRDAQTAFNEEVTDYGKRLNDYSEQNTDMVGTPMSP